MAGNPFANTTFVITATGDTSARQSFGSGFFIDHISATINITGIGVLTFTTATRTFVNNSVSLVGFSRAGVGGADLYNGPTDAAFGTWDMLSSIGPIGGIAGLLQWTLSLVNTDAGVLVFNNALVEGTFRAVVGTRVPEPSTVLLFAMALLAFGLLQRHLRAKV